MTHPPDDETRRALGKLAVLARMQERAAAEDRPAMAHACQLLISLEIGALQTLAKPGGATPPSPEAGPRD